MFQDKTATIFVLTAFVSGLCGAFFYPLSSLFIVEQLGASPMMLSMYMVIAVSSSVIVSQFIAKQSDKGWPRKWILVGSLSSYFITVTSFSVVREYWLAVTIAALFGSISGAAFGQLFALGREYGDKFVTNSTSFLATMRAGISIAWVFGPPGAFMLKANFGYSSAFLVSAVIVLLAIVLIVRYLPDGEKALEEQVPSRDKENGLLKKRTTRVHSMVVLYCVVLVCTFIGGNLYVTSMPLYLSQELMVDPNWLGVLFGTAALCEIPVMLAAGKFADRFGTVKVMMFGLVSGIAFYMVMLTNTDFTTMLAAQVLNGIYIGVCATLGMVVLQDMMRDRLGTASTLFSNMINISMLLASFSVGLVGELYNYFSALYICLATSVLALILLASFWVLQKRRISAVPSVAV